MRREPCPDPLPFVHAATFDTDEAAVVVESGIEDDDWQVETTASCYRILDDPLVATGEPDAL